MQEMCTCRVPHTYFEILHHKTIHPDELKISHNPQVGGGFETQCSGMCCKAFKKALVHAQFVIFVRHFCENEHCEWS